MIWRVIPLTVNKAAVNMAIDSAILDEVSVGRSPPTLRLYRWKPSAVSVGYFQSVNEEVDVEACKKSGVDIVRRITGGGAVYHSYEGEITYSVIVPENYEGIPKDIISSYELICSGIVKALSWLGLKAEFKPVNDIQVDGKKISGNAQTRRKGVILQHGTILLDLNVKEMFNFLKVSKEKISDKLIKSVEERVASLTTLTGVKPDFTKISQLLIKGFSESLKFNYKFNSLTPIEETLVKEYEVNQFNNIKWVFRR
ncbi:MAG: lipoate--protein ligase family protein [Candidatus Odinarchaeum yellowstonii]|uniref:Lipoate--protein ligase family protein n=1 Tax=Odinarchaeota yellowstonii (strain LCB_4) TaxID=1841599 RepID=A0AAF0D2S0_ODILC|nr:MAG: lipoate--protein ligase family protein [Candidatus Odinarchaeum yellowstonii]